MESGSNREVSENIYKKTPKGVYKTNYELSDILVKIKKPSKKKLLDIAIEFISKHMHNYRMIQIT